MADMHVILDDLKKAIVSLAKVVVTKVGELSGHVVRWIQDLPNEMKGKLHVAVIVVAAANNVFLFGIHKIANRLESGLGCASKRLSLTKKAIKHVGINGLFVGGATYGMNILLSKATKYPVRQSILVAFALTSVALRYFTSTKVITKAKTKEISAVEKNEDDVSSKPEDVKTGKTSPKEKPTETAKALKVILKELNKREKALEQREKELDEKEALLKAGSSTEDRIAEMHQTNLGELELNRCVNKFLVRRAFKAFVKMKKSLVTASPNKRNKNYKSWQRNASFVRWNKLCDSEWEKIRKNAPPMEHDVPPPPSMDTSIPASVESVLKKEKYFKSEPKMDPDDSKKLAVPKGMSLEDLRINYQIVKKYTTELDSTLNFILDVMTLLKKSEMNLSESCELRSSLLKDKREAFLKYDMMRSEVSNVKLRSESDELQFYSSAIVKNASEEVQKKLVHKEKVCKFFHEEYIRLNTSLERCQLNISEQELQVRDLRASEFGVPLEEVDEVLQEKKEKLIFWKKILQDYDKEMREFNKPKTDTAKKIKITVQKKLELSEQDKNTLPGLEEWVGNLESNRNLQIIFENIRRGKFDQLNTFHVPKGYKPQQEETEADLIPPVSEFENPEPIQAPQISVTDANLKSRDDWDEDEDDAPIKKLTAADISRVEKNRETVMKNIIPKKPN